MIALAAMIGAAYIYAVYSDTRETVVTGSATLRAADGDSFAIGARKLRLYGIDAPELKQSCTDAAGDQWQCGTAAHGALIAMLAQPGLACQADAQERFGRSLATCQTAATSDVAAAQVRAGMAVSAEFNGMREYGREEDEARSAKRGIWQGRFIDPKTWRALHQRNYGRTAAKPTS